MVLIPDDPIVRSILDRGVPPWVPDDPDPYGYLEEPEDDFEGDGDVFYGNQTEAF